MKALIPVLAILLLLTTSAPADARRPGETVRNPISASFADTFADPAVIQGKDGWWYAYSTADPLRAGDDPGIMHIARTRDWRTWDYLGTVFDDTNRPSWATATSGLWAPDVRYVAGRYVLYFTVTDTTLNPGDDSAIGVATAPTPVGPWTPSDTPVVAPRPGNGGFLWTFDPAGFTDVQGRSYLYYGSYNGGLWVTRLSCRRADPRRVGHPGGDRQPVRGQLRGPPRRLVLPDGLGGELLRRSHHRLLRVRRSFAITARAVRRRRRHLVAGVGRRRDHGADPERERLDRRRSPRHRHRHHRSDVHRLPRHRPRGPVAERALRHQPPTDAAGPARLDRRLAPHAGRCRSERRSTDGPGDRVRSGHHRRGSRCARDLGTRARDRPIPRPGPPPDCEGWRPRSSRRPRTGSASGPTCAATGPPRSLLGSRGSAAEGDLRSGGSAADRTGGSW